MAKYSMEQKAEAVRLYIIMGKEGTCYIADTPIHNIRALCKALNISSQSLYRWAEKFNDVLTQDDLKKDKRIKCASENFCKAYQSDYDDGYGNCNMLGECDDYRTDFKAFGFKTDVHDYPRETYEGFGLQKEIEPMTFKMGTTFFQTMAQGLGIKNYRMPLKQLYLTIGTELIKLSGLVENGVREELRIE